MAATLVVFFIACCLLLQCPTSQALIFDIPGGSSKCVGEEIDEKTLVLADYNVVGSSSPETLKISTKVTSPFGALLHSADSVPSGQFGFTTTQSGNYMACFWVPGSPHGQTTTIDLKWKIGSSAKDWAAVAKKEKVSEMELELRKLEEQVLNVYEEMAQMRDREAAFRDLSEATNTRVVWLGILSVVVCLGVAGWQATYLKGYFERKKIL